MIWEQILILLHHLFLLLPHTSTFICFFHFPECKTTYKLFFFFFFFSWPILFVVSGKEGLLILKNHIEITAPVSWSLVKNFVYNLYIVAPNQFLLLPSSEKSWMFICIDFDLALLLEWRKVLTCEQNLVENHLEKCSEF